MSQPESTVEQVMGARELQRTVQRLASEILERLGEPAGFALVGVVRGGQQLAERLADAIFALEGSRPLVGSLDITLYRDDLYTGIEKPVLGQTLLPFEINGRGLVLVDDVLFTGRTVRAALDELMDYGRPRFIQLAVLVDRGHRELPIAPDFVGRRLTTAKTDRVDVVLDAAPELEEGVRVERRGPAGVA
jgi:pyrimidine operon attenuation protein/uracil phosphoribosyltransferase